MPWQAIWFEPAAGENEARCPESLQGLNEPITYPYAHGFIEAEQKRLRSNSDPSTVFRDGERRTVFYSLTHDGGEGGLERQGCRILEWLFRNFSADGDNIVSARFCEIPLVIHEPHPVKAAAMANGLLLLRFLGARPDQAIAKIALYPWTSRRGSTQLAVADYEERVLQVLQGEIFYPEGVDLFDVLERADLKAYRELALCCQSQIGFVLPLLEWIDECWPQTAKERAGLQESLRKSLADEVQYAAKSRSQ